MEITIVKYPESAYNPIKSSAYWLCTPGTFFLHTKKTYRLVLQDLCGCEFYENSNNGRNHRGGYKTPSRLTSFPKMEMLKKMSVLGLAMKLVLAGVLIASLVLAVAFSQQEVYAQTAKTLNITVYAVNGSPAAGASCSILTNVSPLPQLVTTDSHGKASVSLPSSASTAYVSCNLGNSNGSNTASLNNNVTNIKVFLH